MINEINYTLNNNTNILKNIILNTIIHVKGQDILTIDVRNKSHITDYIIICTGNSNIHIISIANHIIKNICSNRSKISKIKGKNLIDWVAIDLTDVIVHVMQEKSRKLYELEKLWS